MENFGRFTAAFYQVTKYKGAPERLPEVLHWFKWEAYLTWVSVSLLFLVYYLGGQGTLLPSNTSLAAWQGVVLGLRHSARRLGVLRSTLQVAPQINAKSLGCSRSTTPFTHRIRIDLRLYRARAAYLHVGALIGTCMAANVFRNYSRSESNGGCNDCRPEPDTHPKALRVHSGRCTTIISHSPCFSS